MSHIECFRYMVSNTAKIYNINLATPTCVISLSLTSRRLTFAYIMVPTSHRTLFGANFVEHILYYLLLALASEKFQCYL